MKETSRLFLEQTKVYDLDLSVSLLMFFFFLQLRNLKILLDASHDNIFRIQSCSVSGPCCVKSAKLSMPRPPTAVLQDKGSVIRVPPGEQTFFGPGVIQLRHIKYVSYIYINNIIYYTYIYIPLYTIVYYCNLRSFRPMFLSQTYRMTVSTGAAKAQRPVVLRNTSMAGKMIKGSKPQKAVRHDSRVRR